MIATEFMSQDIVLLARSAKDYLNGATKIIEKKIDRDTPEVSRHIQQARADLQYALTLVARRHGRLRA